MDEFLVDLRSVLNAFVFNKDLEPELDMTHLSPKDDEVWEFRSYCHRPHLRLFGSFALPSIFVATDCKVRDDLEKTHGPKWDRTIKDTKYAISCLFGEHLPFTAPYFTAYLRGATYV